jgi:outer membrane protein TolC
MKIDKDTSRNRLTALAALFLFLCPAAAEYKLQDILNLASQKAEDLQIIEQSYNAGKQEIKEYIAWAYPQVHFTAEGAYFNNSPKQYGVLADIFGLPEDMRFKGTEYSWFTSLEQPLFTFGRLSVVHRMSKTQKQLIGKQKDLHREQFFISVIQAYNLAVLAQVEMEVAEKSLESSKKFYTMMDIDYTSGARPKIDWLQAKSLLAQATAEEQLARTRHEVASNRLKNLVGMEGNEKLKLTVGESMYPARLFNAAEGISGKNTRLLEIKEIQLQLANDRVKFEKTRLYPTVSLNGLVGNQFSIQSDMPDSLSQPSPLDLANYEYFNYRIGLRLNWTLFDGFGTLSSHRKAWALSKIEESNLSKMKKQDRVQLDEARKLVKTGAEVVEAASAAESASRMAYDQARIDLEAGAINISQYIDIEKQFKQNQLFYYRARAEELMAHINLKLALGHKVFD